MKINKLDVGSKLPLYILLTCIVSFLLLGVISYFSVGNILTEQCKKNALEYAQIAASEIDGDRFAQITSEDDEYFNIVYNILDRYRQSELVTYAYTMRYVDGKVTFVVDADENDPAKCGEEYPLNDYMIPAFNGTVSYDKYVTTDQWGAYFSAYAPIFTDSGSVAGIVGCDIVLSSVYEIKASLRNIIIILLSLFFVVYYVLYHRLSKEMISRDNLTDLSNYDGLMAKGEDLKKSGKLADYSAVLINIKDFKYLNQKMGANSGDLVLRGYGAYLTRNVSSKEFVSRTGSDNFLVLVLKENEKAFVEKLNDFKLRLSADDKEEIISIFVRCGIYPIGKDDTIKEVLNSASVALKETRNSSSKDIVRFEANMVNNMVEEKRVLADYKDALKNGEFTVYYQPKVNIDNYRLCGAEALVRWIKDGKVIPPIKFIPVLEKENKIAELDFFVFETVCKNICEWKKQGIEPCRISSNFSKIHLANPNFAEDVIEIVKRYNVEPRYIEIELTESSGYSDFDALTHFVDRMNHEHIHTSIDDFGTGYSSLSMLKDINVDVVKIDKSFLSKTGSEDSQQEKMLGNVIRMINDLDRTVICEGVENEEQLDFLKKAECNIIQGYFFDKPLPREEFEKRLRDPEYKHNK